MSDHDDDDNDDDKEDDEEDDEDHDDEDDKDDDNGHMTASKKMSWYESTKHTSLKVVKWC